MDSMQTASSSTSSPSPSSTLTSTLTSTSKRRQRQVRGGPAHGDLARISQVVESADSKRKYELHYQRLIQPHNNQQQQQQQQQQQLQQQQQYKKKEKEKEKEKEKQHQLQAQTLSSSNSSSSSKLNSSSSSNSTSTSTSTSSTSSSSSSNSFNTSAARQQQQQQQQQPMDLKKQHKKKQRDDNNNNQQDEQKEEQQKLPPYVDPMTMTMTTAAATATAAETTTTTTTTSASATMATSNGLEPIVSLPQLFQLEAPSNSPTAAEVTAARFKTRDLSYADDGVRVRVEFYDSENTLKERLQMYFIKDHTVSLYVRTAKLVLNILSCYLYICRVIMDRGPAYANCYECQPVMKEGNSTTQQQQQQQQQSLSKFDTHPYDGPINFRALFWVDRGPILWTMQTTVAVICLLEAILMQYLTYKNSIFSIISFHFTLELVTNTPFIISIFWKELRTLFVPGFLNCWLAKQCLEAMLNGLSIVRQSSVFSHRLTILSATVFCLIFTSACGFQHHQRSGGRDNITIFESIYFVVVTFSTVGYGDLKPETWPSQLFIMVMICVALIVLPTQFEQLAYFWIERKKLGASYAHHSNRHEKHVVVCSTTLRADTIMDFLNEFYAHPLLQTFSVVLLSPCELDTTMKLVLQTPTWNNRVVYIQGSALKASDLIRARMQSAEACFILAARNYNDRSAADEHTILRSWAIRDFSPYVPQYVQIFRTENKIHVAFAEHVVCDDEFKYALLANNCLIPGTSTLVTLLLHTSQRETRRRRLRRAASGGGGGITGRGGMRHGIGATISTILCWRQLKRSRVFRSLFCRQPFSSSSSSSDSGGSPVADSQGDIRRKINEAAARLNNHQTNIEEGRNANNDVETNAAAAATQPNTSTLNDTMRIEGDVEGGERERGKGRGRDNNLSDVNNNKNNNNNNNRKEDEDEDETFLGPEWKRLYGKCSANEIYHIRLSDSRFFGEYQGKSFTYASFHSHRKFGVALIGIQTDMRGTWPIMLNPGPSYVLKSGDILFYINITKEENSTLMPMMNQDKCQQPYQSLAGEPPPLVPSHPPPPPPPIGSLCNVDPFSGIGAAVPEMRRESRVGGTDSSATYIRIESSSPTAGLMGEKQKHQQLDTSSRKFSSAKTELTARLLPEKHSVADGASIVARSLCSVAGIASGMPIRDRDRDDEDEQELHHLTANLLAKRTSSASTSAAMVATVGVGSSAPGPAGTGGLLSAKQRQTGSTLELAALATGLRKGSNMSISSSRSKGDVSPTRLKQVVSGLAVKMKRVKLGKSLTHLTIPRMDYGGGNSASSTESFVNARGRRPSIAPVPAMMGESEDHDSDHDREQESYFSTMWQSPSESSPIVKKFVFCTTYVGVSPTLCYLLQKKKPACCLQLIEACSHCTYKNARQYNWPNRCIILASDFASNGIYNFLVPLRAHFHNPSELRPIVLLLERKPSPQFIDAISWFPMVYWMPGSIDNLDDLINAGINLAHSVVVTNKESTNSAEEDYLADCNTIVAVQSMFKMFPSVGIITELSQSSNMRFMQFRAHDVLFGGLSMANYYPNNKYHQHRRQILNSASSCHQLAEDHDNSTNNNTNQQQHDNSSNQQSGTFTGNAIRDRIQLRKLHSQFYTKTMGKEVNSHAYKYRLPFAAGNVFSASMLDTLLYQAFVKDYMITMVRLLLGIDQAPGSGFLSSMKITKDDLWIRTYGRLYQRLCSTTCEIPLGIYRTEPLDTQHGRRSFNAGGDNCSSNRRGRGESSSNLFSFNTFASQQASYEHATEELERIEITNMVKNRLRDLGMLVSDYDDSLNSRNSTFSYVIINPNCDIHLREGDIIYLIRPSPIHSRKLFMHRANSVRHSQAPNATTTDPTNNIGTTPAPAPVSGIGTGIEQMKQKQASRDEIPTGSGVDGICNQRAPTNSENISNCGGRSSKRASQEQATMKSCLSDGDFAGILIKLNDDQELSTNARQSVDSNAPSHHHYQHQHQHQHNNLEKRALSPNNQMVDGQDCGSGSECNSLRKNRRRSSCSDAEDSKRFDSMNFHD